MEDAEANPHKFPVMTHPESVVTGRSLSDLVEEFEEENQVEQRYA